MDDRNLFTSEVLPGAQPGTILYDIYEHLAQGHVLTTLDAVVSNRTVCLSTYISMLRKKYGIEINDQWITLSNNKKIKQYWISK